jgi:hypothetical protein
MKDDNEDLLSMFFEEQGKQIEKQFKEWQRWRKNFLLTVYLTLGPLLFILLSCGIYIAWKEQVVFMCFVFFVVIIVFLLTAWYQLK